MTTSGKTPAKPNRAAVLGFSDEIETAGGYVRISKDRFQLEAGITRQKADIRALGKRVKIKNVVWYPENDTSAFKKQAVTLPDGSVVYRVVRPEFARMLEDLKAGRIQAVVFYDLDRLVRQPRDLEDLIDIVERNGAPVFGVTGSIDLRTSNGRAMARVLTAMANKSSEDTARRVQRAKLADAENGKILTRRRFGRNPDGSIIEEEAEVLRWALGRIMAGKAWSDTIKQIEDGPVRPVGGGRWHLNTLRNMLMNPQVAGIAVYRGALRPQGAGGVTAADPSADALRHTDGSYVMSGLDPIIQPEDWDAFVAKIRAKHEGTDPSPGTAAKYLLSGLCRCGNVKADGTLCNHRLVGRRIKKRTTGEMIYVYGCPGKAHGGCAGVQRNGAMLDELITDLFYEYLEKEAERQPSEPAPMVERSEEQIELDDAIARLAALREAYARGDKSVSQETFFSTVPLLEARIRKLKAHVQRQATELAKYAPASTPARVMERFKAADTAGKRAILETYLIAIEVRPSTRRGRASRKNFDVEAIIPAWKQTRPDVDMQEPDAE